MVSMRLRALCGPGKTQETHDRNAPTYPLYEQITKELGNEPSPTDVLVLLKVVQVKRAL
jgi:hypothetical protein